MDIKSKKSNEKKTISIIKYHLENLKVHLEGLSKRVLNRIRNISLNNRMIMLSIGIGFVPILAGIIVGHPFINRMDRINSVEVRDEIKSVNECLDNLNYLLEDSEGTFREEAINVEVQDMKDENLKNLKKVKEEFEEYKRNNIDEVKEETNNKYYNELKMNVTRFENEYNKSDEEYKNIAVMILNHELQDVKSKLEGNVNVEYFLKSSNGNIITNIYGQSINEILRDNHKYYDYLAYSGVSGHSAQERYISKSMKPCSDLVSITNVTTKIIRIPKQLKAEDAIYNALNNVENNNSIFVLSSILIFLDVITILVLIFVRNKDIVYNEKYFSGKHDKVFWEMKILMIIVACICMYVLYEDNCVRKVQFIKLLIEALGCSLIVYLCVINIYDFLMDLKNKNIKNNLLFFKLYKKIDNIRNDNINDEKAIVLKTCILSFGFILYLILICYTCGIVGYHCCPWSLEDIINGSGNTIEFVIISILATAIIFVYMILNIINLYSIKSATEKILEGDYEGKIKIYGCGQKKIIAENLVNIKSGFGKAIKEALKSEKMKSELITNVSHDLKTPLTSIINYVDLLSKDNISEDEKNKYLDILNNRSLRLKALIEDLFEAAKASSGSLEFKLETLNPVALLRQTLGEFEDSITSCGLTIIKTLPQNKLSIIADGKRTFRVIQNLISNITKYSMKNSRVYIDIIEEEKYVLMVFKNISEYQIGFSEEEAMERFKRGDYSRTTEGSGLGLAIAKSLVEGQGGLFKISIDGDLFKAEVRLKKNR